MKRTVEAGMAWSAVGHLRTGIVVAVWTSRCRYPNFFSFCPFAPSFLVLRTTQKTATAAPIFWFC